MAMVYLDHAATSPMPPEVLKAFSEAAKNDFANPSSPHRFAKNVAKKIEKIKEDFLGYLKAPAGFKIFFTGSATESNNQVLYNYLGKKKLLIFQGDHASITEITKIWPGGDVAYYYHDQIVESVTDDIGLIVLTHVNNQSGIILDIGVLATEIKKKNPKIHIHVDCAQSFGKIEINLKKWKVDSIALSAHKIGGPVGIGAIVFDSFKKMNPLFYGGGQQEGLRPSTLSSPLITAFAEATKLKFEKLDHNFDHTKKLNQKIQEEFAQFHFPFAKIASPYILMMIIPEVSSDILLRLLEEKEIYLSSTSACSSKIKGENIVFNAHKVPKAWHKNVLRISFSANSTMPEVQIFINKLQYILTDLNPLIKKKK
jgi:cysteine desulfurase